MKRLLKFETFVPRKVANRAAMAIDQGLFVYNQRETYLRNDGKDWHCALNYIGSKSGSIVWIANVFLLFDLDIALRISLEPDLAAIVIDYANDAQTRFTPAIWFKAGEVEKLAARISKEVIGDMRASVSEEQPAAELYALADGLYPLILQQLMDLKPTV